MHFLERKILLPCYQNLIASSIKQTPRGRGCSDVVRLIQSSKRAQPCAPFVIKFGRERVASVSGEGGSTEARQRGDRRRFEGERIESRSIRMLPSGRFLLRSRVRRLARPRDGVFSRKPWDWSRTRWLSVLFSLSLSLSLSFRTVSSAVASLYVDLRKSTTHRRHHCSSSAFVLSSRVHRQPATVVRCSSRSSSSSSSSILDQPPTRTEEVEEEEEEEEEECLEQPNQVPRLNPQSGLLLFPSNLTHCSSLPPPFFLPFIRPSACLPLSAKPVRSSFDVAGGKEGEREERPRVTHRLWILMTRAMNSDRAKGGSSAVNPLCASLSLSLSLSFSLSLSLSPLLSFSVAEHQRLFSLLHVFLSPS